MTRKFDPHELINQSLDAVQRYHELRKAVIKMRRLQCEYFKTKNKATLIEAKKAETHVDALVQNNDNKT